MARKPNGQFLPGTGGRPAGARNKLQAKFVERLAKDFQDHGEEVIKIVRRERPTDYLKIIASIFPKEFLLPDNALEDLSDDELLQALAEIRKARKTDASTVPGVRTEQ